MESNALKLLSTAANVLIPPCSFRNLLPKAHSHSAFGIFVVYNPVV